MNQKTGNLGIIYMKDISTGQNQKQEKKLGKKQKKEGPCETASTEVTLEEECSSLVFLICSLAAPHKHIKIRG